MTKTKKVLSVLSISALAGIMASAALSSTAFGAVDAYTVKVGTDVFEYNTMDLKTSFLNSKVGAESVLYTSFQAKLDAAKSFYAFHDQLTKRYIGYDDVAGAFLADRTNFKLDGYVETTAAKAVTDLPQVIKSVTVVGGVITLTDKQTSVVTGLQVASVSAINNTSFDVKITALAEDMLGATIEVKDNTGKIIAVKPLDIAAGDTTASFDFATAITGDMVGTWTFDGVSVDFDQMAKLAAIYNADTQIGLYNALNTLGVINVKDANIEAYGDALTILKTTVTDVKEFTAVMAQNIVTTTNTKAITADQEEVIVKAVTDAIEDTNQVTLLKALQNDAFVKVNADWISTVTGYMAKISEEITTIEDIQTVINTVNDTKIKETWTLDGTDRAKLTASKALITAYATVDDKGVITDTAIKAAPATINIQIAIIDVAGATTPTNLKAKLTALATLVNPKTGTAVLDMTKYVDVSGKLYITKIGTIKAPVTAENINKAILDVNADVSTELLGTVTKAADSTKLLAALKAYPGIKYVADSNKAVYWVIDNGNFDVGTVSDLTTMQTAVNDANILAINNTDDADVKLAAIKVLELSNVIDANKAEYRSDLEAGISKAKTPAEVKTAITAINTAVSEAVQLKVINEATTATTVNTALLALGLDDYLNVPSTDRLFVAGGVLVARDKIVTATGVTAKQFKDLNALKSALTTATTAQQTALSGVNTLKSDVKITEVVAALKLVGNETFNDMSASQQAVIAENFSNALVFNAIVSPATNSTLKTPFKTLSSIITLMK